MSDNSETWQWVDEDPIEKLLKPAPAHAPMISAPGISVPTSSVPSISVSSISAQSISAQSISVHSSADGVLASARAYFARQQYEEAARIYSDVAASEPGHRTAHFDLAVCREKLGQWSEAAHSFRRSIEIDPGRVEAILGLGSCLLHLEGAEQALECFERVLQSGSRREAALLGKAASLQKLARYHDAERAYAALLDTDAGQGEAEALANLIAMSASRQDMAALERFSNVLLRLDPQAKSALQGLAAVAIAKGDQAGALEYCSRLVEVDPDSFEGRFNLRFAEQRMDAPQQAARSIA